MGYYTRHTLSIISGDDFYTDYEEDIANTTNYGSLFDGEIKWYNCEDDMKSYSKRYPTVTFCVEGEGEESGDIWKAYFKNGKMFRTKAVLVFEEFTEDKLE